MGPSFLPSRRAALAALLASAALLLGGCAIAPLAPDAVREALAPTGKLRVGMYQGSPTSLVVDRATGERRGITWDLGRELAARLGVPFEPVEFPRVAEVFEALKAGRVDVTFTNASAARQREADFTPALVDLELGYLVVPGSPVNAIADVDQPGRRIGVSQGSTSQATLSGIYKHAAILTAPNLRAAGEMLTGRQIDAFATNKAILFELSDTVPGSRVLEGRWGLEHLGFAIPKGRDAGMGWLRVFALDMRNGGLVDESVKRAGLRGSVRPE